MNTLVTLFGGLAAVLLLYAAGGYVRSLQPVLRALLASLLPLLAYFVTIIGRWPGLDVVAIHISVFLAAGLVLHVLTQFRRRSGGHIHWVPKLLVAFFLGLVVINASLLYIATKGLPGPLARWWLGGEGGAVYSGFSGVVTHGQDAAKAVSAELSQSYRESRLGWQVDVDGLDADTAARTVDVRVRDRTGLPVARVDAGLRVLRPGAAEPSAVLSLPPLDAGRYGGVLSLPAGGRWLVELQLSQDGQVQYRQTWEVVAP
jgi:nitrogen fixation protein FixH